MDEEQQIKSLGASVVESETFEKKYIQSLENELEKLNKETEEETVKTEEAELEDGELEDTVDEPAEKVPEAAVIDDQGKLRNDDVDVSKGPVIIGVPQNETAEEKRVRTGEMTPFGTVIERNKADPRATFLDFTAYLKSQRAFEKRSPSKSAKQVDGSKSNSKSKARKRKALDAYSGHNSKRKAPRLWNSTEDLQSSKRVPWSDSASEDDGPIAVSEVDSDYVPPDSDGDWKPDPEDSNGQSSRKTAARIKKKQKYKEVDTDESFSEEEGVQKGRSKKNPDDGDLKTYQARLDSWKAKEKRFSGHFHELDGGFRMPEHIWNSLYDYQKVGVNWLWELHQKNCGGILGDEMGLGKTIQIIAFLAGLASSNLLFRFTSFRGLGPTLLVCPATVMHQWVKEFHQWWPPFRVVILHETGSFTGSKEALIRSTVSTNGVLVTSYAGVVNNLNEILKHAWHYVILDEGHKIRNPDAQITIAVKQIPTSHRLILSGSPLQNNLKELWSLFDFVFPGKLGTLPVFMEQFSVPITQGGYSNASEIQVAAAYKCAKTLRDIIKPYLLRRLKSDVKDHLKLPEKTEQVLFCKLTEEQRACYISYINSKEVESIVGGRINMFSGLINLRKICNHPHLFDGGPKKLINPLKKKLTLKSKTKKASDNPYKSLNPYVSDPETSDSEFEMDDPDEHYGNWMKSGKMVVLETLLKLWAKQKHKVLLFTQSRQMLFILENFVRRQNYTYLKMDGTVSVGSRQPMIKQFNEDPDLFVFLLTTKVGGLGVNLTGANRVVIFDPDWNPSTDSQARERAWRIGQERQVTVYRLITSGTIEEKIYHRQIFKQFLTNRVLKDPKQKRFFKSNDVMELFSFNEAAEKGADSEALFVGTGSFLNKKAVKRRLKKSKSDLSDATPKERSSGKFRGVPNLVKQKTSKKEDLGVPQDNEKQDDYVLRKLFRKSNVSAALQHDNLVDSTEPDYMLVEKEAERVAQDAVKVLKQSRSQCWTAESGRVTWTGSHGSVRDNSSTNGASASSGSPQKNRLRFKRSEKPATVTSESASTEMSFFSTAENTSDAPMSTSELIAAIRARKREIMAEEAGDNNQENDGSSSRPVDVDLVKNEYVELLRDIREFIAFQAQSDGQATTDEILEKFAGKLPAKDSPIFKQMLSQLCTFRRVDGKGLWKLKPEFQ